MSAIQILPSVSYISFVSEKKTTVFQLWCNASDVMRKDKKSHAQICSGTAGMNRITSVPESFLHYFRAHKSLPVLSCIEFGNILAIWTDNKDANYLWVSTIMSNWCELSRLESQAYRAIKWLLFISPMSRNFYYLKSIVFQFWQLFLIKRL